MARAASAEPVISATFGRTIAIGIFILAIALRVWTAFSLPVMLHADAQGYDLIGQSLARGEGFARAGRLTALEDPLYPGMLGLTYALGGHDYRLVQVVQSVLNAAMCLGVMLVGTTLFGGITGALSGLWVACYPSFVMLPSYLLSEALFVPLLVLMIWCWSRWKRVRSTGSAVALGASAALAGLTRASVLPLPVAIFGWEWLRASREPAQARGVVRRQLGAACLALGLVIAPWTLRNWLVFRSVIPISTKVGYDLAAAFLPPEGKLYGTLTPPHPAVARAREMASEVEADQYLKHEVVSFIIRNPGEVARQLALKLVFLVTPFDWEILGYRVYNVAFSFAAPLGLLGMWHVRRRWREMDLAIWPMAYYVVLSLATYASPRLRLPMEPFLIVFAVHGCLTVMAWCRSAAVSGALLGAWCAAHAMLWWHAEAIRLSFKQWLTSMGLW